ncbi:MULTISPECIES: hypothetical protein [Amycolatopsis]|nr:MULTISPECIES: hypothetical protein [Amycolatopsis]
MPPQLILGASNPQLARRRSSRGSACRCRAMSWSKRSTRQ